VVNHGFVLFQIALDFSTVNSDVSDAERSEVVVVPLVEESAVEVEDLEVVVEFVDGPGSAGTKV
jgi:hypothetical protein